MIKIFSFAILLTMLSILISCSKGGELPPIADSAISNSDDLNPQTDPEDPLENEPQQPFPNTQRALQEISPSDVSPSEVNLVYRRIISPLQLGEIDQSKKCHPDHLSKCIWNSQVIFGFDTEVLNKNYPKELWEISNVEIVTSLYSQAISKREELFCIHNLKLCSGKLNKNKKDSKFFIKNPKFWTGANKNHISNNNFTQVLETHQREDHLWVVENYNFDISILFNLDTFKLRTLLRKENFLSFSISDDTFVQDPILKVYLLKRQAVP